MTGSHKLPKCNKEVRDLVKQAVKGGAKFLGYSGKGHVKVSTPTGKVLTMPASPSCPRWRRNALRDLRAAGVDL